ncbi:MAG TPA: Rieske 2Fe-2S domain-containing protein [Streptosporangiaceae bacterium]|nr:Rieske 2Fe-2S domain-containing protein [Streptosporangiaceae bacterium]
MSDTNPKGAAGDDSGASWPEYLGGMSYGAGGGGGGAGGGPSGGSAGGAGQPEQPGPRHRVIGTPSPTAARTLLPEPDGGSRPPRQPELPPEPADPARARTAERLVAALFILAMLAGFGFLVSYALIGVGSLTAVLHSNLFLGGSLSLAFLFLGGGAVIWVRNLMPAVELTEQRHPMHATEAERAAFKETFEEGAAASQFVKRPLVRRTLIAATVPLAVAPLFLLRDLGPLPGTSLGTTVWRKGLRLLVYGTGRPITPAEFSSPGSLITVGPEGYLDNDDAMAKAAVIIIKLRPGQLVFGPPVQPGHASPPNLTVPNWTVDNIVAYSKICTHVGCPAALYEQTTHHILCPCHQSTFDATRGAMVIFGPATRALPQLPIGVDSEGYLVATGPFNEPVGPSYWERS